MTGRCTLSVCARGGEHRLTWPRCIALERGCPLQLVDLIWPAVGVLKGSQVMGEQWWNRRIRHQLLNH